MSMAARFVARRLLSCGTPQPRSVYVAQLRRAFLLRAHPDRFRSSTPVVRRQQANLIQALSDRMTSADFLAYSCDQSIPTRKLKADSKLNYPYVLENKDGSLVQHTINLQDSVENVLKSLVSALLLSGVSMPLPPSAPPPRKSFSGPHEILWAPQGPRSAGHHGVNHQYDVNTNRGRDLLGFLANLDLKLVERRRAARIDVTAVALVARRAFSFLSIDGTNLGWSSDSLAILLRSLVALHEEHCSKFHVESFYPLQLVWSSEDFDDPLDLYGGILYLNPASTPIQWLDTFLLVTRDTLETLTVNRAQLEEHKSRVQGTFGGVKFQKGHSSSPKEYHEFMSRLAESPLVVHNKNYEGGSSTALTLESIVVRVEASYRRAVLSKEGTIHVGVSMDIELIARAVSKHAREASERVAAEAQRKHQCRETIDRVQWELGLQRVYQKKLVRADQVIECLMRLLDVSERDHLKRNLAGNSLSIAPRGHLCHLGDDGSVVIPWDWR